MSVQKKLLIKKTNRDDVEKVANYGHRFFGEGADRIKACFQCGTCTGSCPSGRRTAYRTKEIFRKVQLGLLDEVLEDPDLWLCTTCYTCHERCPRNLSTTDLIRTIRNLAFQKGVGLKAPHIAVAGFLPRFGHAVPLDAPTGEVRENLNLGKPPTAQFSDKAREELSTILKETGFSDNLAKIVAEQERKKKEAEEKAKAAAEGK